MSFDREPGSLGGDAHYGDGGVSRCGWVRRSPAETERQKRRVNRSFAVVESAYNMAGSSDAAANLRGTVAAVRQDTMVGARHRGLAITPTSRDT